MKKFETSGSKLKENIDPYIRARLNIVLAIPITIYLNKSIIF
jgi:hypothetical protein